MFLKQIVGYVQRTETAIVPTTPMINEYFGVSVVSEPRMASAGVEPWMGSSTDKHLPRSTICTKRICQFQQKQSNKDAMRLPSLVGIAIPSTGYPDPILALRHP